MRHYEYGKRTILMAIKPLFAERILNGIKKYELRRKVFPLYSGDRVIIYESSPTKAIVGEFIIGKVFEYSSSEVIRMIRRGQLPGSDEEDIPYVTGERSILVLEVIKPLRYSQPIPLELIKKWIPKFRPPISYMVVRDKKLLLLIEQWKRYVNKW